MFFVTPVVTPEQPTKGSTMPTRFTDRFVSSLKPKAERYQLVEEGGLGIRISKPNQKGRSVRSWFFLYTFEGRQRRFTLGHYPETTLKEARSARDAAASLLDKGIDPAAKDDDSISLGKLIDLYKEGARFSRLAKGTQKNYCRAFDAIDPTLNRMKLESIKRRDIKQRLDKKLVDTPHEAGTQRVALSALFTWALDQDLIEYNPAHNIKLDIPSCSRDRVLTADEIRILWRGLDQAPAYDGYKDVLRMELTTALRIGSLVSTRREDLDLEQKLLRTPREQVKGGRRDLWTPLSPMAMAIIERALETYAADSEFLFPAAVKKGAHISANGVGNWLRTMRSAGVIAIAERTTSHDLRRTLATHLSREEVEREYIKQILNHKESDVTAVYIRDDFIAQKRKYLNLWSDRLGEILREASIASSGPL